MITGGVVSTYNEIELLVPIFPEKSEQLIVQLYASSGIFSTVIFANNFIYYAGIRFV